MRTWILLLLAALPGRGAALVGEVVSAGKHRPIAGAFLSTRTEGGLLLTTRSDASGHFRFVEPVEFGEKPLFVGASRSGFLRGIASTRSAVSLRIELRPAAVVSGTVVDADGFPAKRVSVSAERYEVSEGTRRLGSRGLAQTDDLGRYRIRGLEPGEYWVKVFPNNLSDWDKRYIEEDSGKPVKVRSGEERRGVDVRLSLHEGVSVEGRVEGTKDPRIRWAFLQEVGTTKSPVMTYLEGQSFRFRHVQPGEYLVRAVSGNFDVKAGEFAGEHKVRVGGAEVKDVVLRPQEVRPMELKGRVVMEGGGKPVPTVVTLEPSGISAGGIRQGLAAHSREDGSFVVTGILPERYQIQVMPEVKGVAFTPLSARVGERELLRDSFDFELATSGELLVTVSALAIEVRGKLVNRSGKAVPDARLVFLAGKPNSNGGATTDDKGEFHVTLNRPGEYRVLRTTESRQMTDPEYLKKHEKDFPVLRVVEGLNPPVVLKTRR